MYKNDIICNKTTCFLLIVLCVYTNKIMDSATESEHIEKLAKEAESLKIRLEDERQKLNDITRKYHSF